jgi:hypothetical protein
VRVGPQGNGEGAARLKVTASRLLFFFENRHEGRAWRPANPARYHTIPSGLVSPALARFRAGNMPSGDQNGDWKPRPREMPLQTIQGGG